ncbi:MAG: hypothetical protein ACLQPV_01430 [Vulcanimicrobiaceae bacterium]
MQIRYRLLTVALTVAIIAGAVASAGAQSPPPGAVLPPGTPVPGVPLGPTLVKVDVCDATGPGQPHVNYQPFMTSAYTGGTWNDMYNNMYYQPSVSDNAGSLAIEYQNVSNKTMKVIEFGLMADNILLAEVRDTGTFTHGATIKHKFGVSQYIFPIRLGAPKCVALRITYADGSKWVNPKHPQPGKALYSHH